MKNDNYPLAPEEPNFRLGSSFGEDLPMTMQAVFLCDEGLVFAGDLLQSEAPRSWRTYKESKLEVGDDVIVACARNMNLARSIARDIITAVQKLDVQNRGKCIADIGLNRAVIDTDGAECIVMFASPLASFIHLCIYPDGSTRCYSPDRSLAGDTGNPANYWAEMYFDRKLSMQSVVNLAAHIVVGAAMLNPRLIGGLEIVTAGDGKFTRWGKVLNEVTESQVKADLRDMGGKFPAMGLPSPSA